MLDISGISLVAVGNVQTSRTALALQKCIRQAQFLNAYFFGAPGYSAMAEITYVPIPSLAERRDRREFILTTLPIYRAMFGTHLLVIQHNGFILKPEAWDAKFLHYDYIGAPWEEGGDGFSLYSRCLLEFLSPRPGAGWLEGIPNEHRTRTALETKGIKFAPPDVARRFVAWDEPHEHAFGFQGWNTQPLGASASMFDACITELYYQARYTPSDINEHVPTLNRLAGDCQRVTEMGVRSGVSTAAFLFARPDSITCYDLDQHQNIATFAGAALEAGIDFTFVQGDVLTQRIAETDLLFLDTYHTYDQVRQELILHAGQVRRYLVLHDTTTFAVQGEGGQTGIWAAVQEFLASHPEWRLAEKYENNNGLTVLARCQP